MDSVRIIGTLYGIRTRGMKIRIRWDLIKAGFVLEIRWNKKEKVVNET
jgi:hypothetical protein